MAGKPSREYAQLTADMIKRTVAVRTTIIGPDGELQLVWGYRSTEERVSA